MGTDISLYAERLDGHSWQPVPTPHEERSKRRKKGSKVRATLVEPLDIGRPYELFTVLYGSSIGMRNKGLEVPCISKPRGLPDGVNPLLRQRVKEAVESKVGCGWGLSWLMVSEFLNFPWDDRRVHHEAFVWPRYACRFHPDRDFPTEFPEDAKLYSEYDGGIPAWAVKVEWSESVRAFVGCHDEVSKVLLSLGPPDETRIVYWFDN